MKSRRRSAPAPLPAVSTLTTPFTVTIATTCLHMKLPKRLMCQKCDAFIQSYVPNFCEDIAESWPSDEQMNRRVSTPPFICERPWDQEKYCVATARYEQFRRCEQIYELLGQHKKTLIDANSIIASTEFSTETPLNQPREADADAAAAAAVMTALASATIVPTVSQGTHRKDGGRKGCDDLSYPVEPDAPRRRCFGWYGNKYNQLFQQAVKSACPLQGITMETTGVIEIPDHFPLHRVYSSMEGATELLFCKEPDLGSYVLRSSKCDGTAAGDKRLLCEKCALLCRTTHAVLRKAKTMEKDSHEGIHFTEDMINAMSDAMTFKVVQRIRNDRDNDARNSQKRKMRRSLGKSSKKAKPSDDTSALHAID
jgi:hypothetical protein